jgi:hypothetical protein
MIGSGRLAIEITDDFSRCAWITTSLGKFSSWLIPVVLRRDRIDFSLRAKWPRPDSFIAKQRCVRQLNQPIFL